jgi:hypothetical protein
VSGGERSKSEELIVETTKNKQLKCSQASLGACLVRGCNMKQLSSKVAALAVTTFAIILGKCTHLLETVKKLYVPY